jgi:hypothetical protein
VKIDDLENLEELFTLDIGDIEEDDSSVNSLMGKLGLDESTFCH